MMMNRGNYLERRTIAAGQNIKEKNYWLKKLLGGPFTSSFPHDFPGANTNTHDIAELELVINGDLQARLMGLSNQSPHTLHMILTAALVVLMYKYTGSRDIVIGIPIYKQASQGDFLNTVLVLRNQLTDYMNFKDLLIQVKQTIVEALENQNYPVEVLLDQLGIPLPGNDGSLPDTFVLLENIHDKGYIQHMKTNILFAFLPTDDQVRGRIEYNASYYRKESIESMTCHFKQLLHEAVFNVNIELTRIGMLSPEEKNRLLNDFNRLEEQYPNNRTINRLFEEQEKKSPHHIALVEKEKQLTYRELNKKANQLAYFLREKGVKTNRLVGIIMERSLDMIIVILGVFKSGGAYLPIDPEMPGKRITLILDDANVSFLLAGSSALEHHSFSALQNNRLNYIPLHITPPRAPIKDFNSIPFPDRSLVNYEKYNRYIGQAMVQNGISLQATRGCPYKCLYCHKIWPKTHTVRSAENIFREIKLYYDIGIRRFAFTDDIFNLDRDNSSRFFELVIKNKLDIQIFFPNGVRGDILTHDYIDLMIEAGTINMAFALETASPRVQKLIKKNLNLEKFRDNMNYICKKYPFVILDLFTMHGFPTETEEEAMMTLHFIQDLKWVHFPFVFILTIFPNTEMEKLALQSGISREAINRVSNYAYHELPDTLTFDKNFTLMYQTKFFKEYFLSKERLLHLLPYQMKLFTEKEMLQKYNTYLPTKISDFSGLLEFFELSKQELGVERCQSEKTFQVPNLNKKLKSRSQLVKPDKDALKVLVLDITALFSHREDRFYGMIEAPLGPMYIVTYLKHQLGTRVNSKIAKSRIDFDSYAELKKLLEEFKPGVIGIRCLSYYKDFFHETIAMIRQWGITTPVIAGGPYATSSYSSILQDRSIDLVVFGEGEITFCHIIRCMIDNDGKLPGKEVLEQINGIAFLPAETEDHGGSREILIMDELSPILSGKSAATLVPVNQPRDLAYAIFTSGSTGNPKGVLINHANVSPLLHWGYKHLSLSTKERVVQNLSYFFDWSVWEIFIALTSGTSLYTVSYETMLDPPLYIDFMDKTDISVLHITPTQFHYLSDINRELRTLKYLCIGAEKLSVQLLERSYKLVNRDCRIFNMYGPTEAAIISAVLELTRPGRQTYRNLAGVPIGNPAANAQILVLDENLQICPVNIKGDMYIAGDCLANGYLNDPGKTAGKFVKNMFKEVKGDRLYKTGDIVRWLPDGTIEFSGRSDSQVKIRGHRIELNEIRNQLVRHPSIKEAVVTIIDGKGEEKFICAFYIPAKIDHAARPGNGDLTAAHSPAAELKAYLSKVLPAYMNPTLFVPIEKIPVNPNGKIDMKALMKHSAGGTIGNYAAPRNKIEQQLEEIWVEVIGIEKGLIGIDGDFFELGGNSLNATKITAKISNSFNVRIPLDYFFTRPTIRELAEYIANEKKDVPIVQDDSLVKLKSGTNPGKNLFFIHDGTGEVEAYIEFCNHLDPVLSCWGIRANGIRNYTPQNTAIEHLAEKYIKKIKKIQETGPYLITGWSFGGTVAFQMVKQLELIGEKIQFLALIDAVALRKESQYSINAFTLKSEKRFIQDNVEDDEIKRKLENVSKLDDIWPLTIDHLETNQPDINALKKLITKHAGLAIENSNPKTIKELIFYLNMGRTFSKARALYIPSEKINTPLHFFGASQSEGLLQRDIWDSYCTYPQKFYQVQGDHYSILKMPEVVGFAELFSRVLKSIDKF